MRLSLQGQTLELFLHRLGRAQDAALPRVDWGMEPRPEPPAAVRCLSCRSVYVPESDGSSGCPLCGCVSWLSVEVPEPAAVRRTTDGRIGAVALSVLGWGGMLGRERGRKG